MSLMAAGIASLALMGPLDSSPPAASGAADAGSVEPPGSGCDTVEEGPRQPATISAAARTTKGVKRDPCSRIVQRPSAIEKSDVQDSGPTLVQEMREQPRGAGSQVRPGSC
jgi:hypothetical protein